MKILFETSPSLNKTREKQIETQFKLLNFAKEGHQFQYKFDSDNWLPKESINFSVDSVSYRVIEKPKEVTIYTIVYWSKAFGWASWCTQCEDQYRAQLSTIDQINTKLLKTYVDKVVIS